MICIIAYLKPTVTLLMFIMVDFFYYYLEQEINMPTFGNMLAMEYIRVSALDKPLIS